MRFLYLLILFSFSSSSFAIEIKIEKIISISDSILVSKVGEDLKRFFEISEEGSHYKFFVSKKRIETEKLMSVKKIKKEFTEIWILYQFNYTLIDGMKAGIWLKLDRNLELIEPINLNSVPDFLINDEPSKFLPKEEAKKMAVKYFSEKKFEVNEPKLQYYKKLEKYIYKVTNKSSGVTNNQERGKKEIVELDAFTGDFLRKYETYYGLEK